MERRTEAGEPYWKKESATRVAHVCSETHYYLLANVQVCRCVTSSDTTTPRVGYCEIVQKHDSMNGEGHSDVLYQSECHVWECPQ